MEPRISKVFGGEIVEYQFRDLVTFWRDGKNVKVVGTSAPSASNVEELQKHLDDMQRAINYMKTVTSIALC